MFIVQISTYVHRFSRLYINLTQVLELTLSQSNFADVAIHIVPIFVQPGSHYCWVDRGGINSKLVQGFYTWPSLLELNTRPLDLGSNALTIRPLAPCVKWPMPWTTTVSRNKIPQGSDHAQWRMCAKFWHLQLTDDTVTHDQHSKATRFQDDYVYVLTI